MASGLVGGRAGSADDHRTGKNVPDADVGRADHTLMRPDAFRRFRNDSRIYLINYTAGRELGGVVLGRKASFAAI
jgi:hypothetical protein